MLKIALPKGRMGDKVYSMFERIGLSCREIKEDNRKLVFRSDNGEVSYVLVKPSDVTVYVERGAADIGVVGKDVMLETRPDVYEILDLNIGKCRIAVAGKVGFKDDPSLALRVATKYPNIAKDYFYNRKHQTVEIIKLNGSIELAPIVGLSEVIVDIVETGTTLKENGLCVLDEVCDLSARMVVNQVSMKMENERILKIINDLRNYVEAK